MSSKQRAMDRTAIAWNIIYRELWDRNEIPTDMRPSKQMLMYASGASMKVIKLMDDDVMNDRALVDIASEFSGMADDERAFEHDVWLDDVDMTDARRGGYICEDGERIVPHGFDEWPPRRRALYRFLLMLMLDVWMYSERDELEYRVIGSDLSGDNHYQRTSRVNENTDVMTVLGHPDGGGDDIWRTYIIQDGEKTHKFHDHDKASAYDRHEQCVEFCGGRTRPDGSKIEWKPGRG